MIIRRDFVVLATEEEWEGHTPEKALLAAVLERTYRDLGTAWIEAKDKRSAIQWFLTTKDIHTHSFISFQDCIEGLHLSASQVAYLEECAKAAEIYVENKKKLKMMRQVEEAMAVIAEGREEAIAA